MAKAISRAVAGLAGCLAIGALAETPTVGDVVVRQRWPWSRLVDIGYVLDCEDTQQVDVAVAGYSGTTPLDVPLRSLSGERYGVTRGAHRIVLGSRQVRLYECAAHAVQRDGHLHAGSALHDR